jgi:hypothetical protein
MADTRSNDRKLAFLSPLNLLLLGLLGMVILVYVFVGFSTQDWLWFWPIFDEQPTQIIIHCYGQELPLEPNSPDFLPLTHLVNQQLSSEKRMDDDFISSEDYHQFLQDPAAVSMEMRYENQPIRIHSYRSFFSDVDTLSIVLQGDAQNELTVYGARQGEPTPGVIRIAGGQKILAYIIQQNLCQKPCKE